MLNCDMKLPTYKWFNLSLRMCVTSTAFVFPLLVHSKCRAELTNQLPGDSFRYGILSFHIIVIVIVNISLLERQGKLLNIFDKICVSRTF